MIYLDWAATAPPAQEALDAMLACAREAWQNPSAAYSAAGEARGVLRAARRTIAELLGCQPQEIVFTSGGSEGNAQAMSLAEGGHVVLSAVEHRSVTAAARRWGCRAAVARPDAQGCVRAEAVRAALRPDTKLISVQVANNETGALHEVEQIGSLARDARVPFHCDAVQAFGHVPIDVRRCGIDILTLSAHKFGGPAGVGALYVRQGLPLRPLLAGHQEFGLRAGTENVPGICGMAAAARLAAENMEAEAERERGLMDEFTAELAARAPQARQVGGGARLPGIRAILLPGLPSEIAVSLLEREGILVSGGAACASQDHEPSPTYLAMGLSEADARCVIRVSVGRLTTGEEMRAAAEAVARVWRAHGGE